MNIQSKIAEKIDNDKFIKKIIEFSGELKVYAVGGIIRDYYFGMDNYDKDIVVFCDDVKNYSKNLANYLENTSFVELDDVNKIYRLVKKENDKYVYIDIAAPYGHNIEEDLSRRDLRMNAIAYDIKNHKFIDIFNGFDNLENKKIDIISENNIIDDSLRLLRIFRFQANTGFEIDENLMNIVKKYKNLIHKPAKERIMTELMKMFEGKYTDIALINMDKTELLCEILPVFNNVKKVPPNSHHHLPLIGHSIETVRQIENFYENAEFVIKEHLNKIDFGGFSRIAHLKLAGFMHDIGKYSCWTIEENTGRHRFMKHESIGADMCVPILKELKFSNKQINYIKSMIKNHIYPSHVISTEELTDKIKMRYIRKMGDDVIDNIILAKSDRLSARGEAVTEEMVNNNINGLNNLLHFYLDNKDKLKPLPKLLSGNDIMKLTGLKPSKELGEIVSKLNDAIFDGDITSVEEAKKFIKNIICKI